MTEVTDFTQEDLNPGDVMLLDTWDQVRHSHTVRTAGKDLHSLGWLLCGIHIQDESRLVLDQLSRTST